MDSLRPIACLLALSLAAACGGSSSSGPPQQPPATPPTQTTDGGSPPLNVDAGPPDAGPPGPLGGGDWLQYRYSPTGTSENPGVFEKAEVANIASAWPIGDDRPGAHVVSQAVITGDTIFFTTETGNVVALNAQDGSVRWSRGGYTGTLPYCNGSATLGFWAAPALASDTLYVAAANGRVYALDPATGNERWSVAVADPSSASRGEFIEASPAVSLALGKLYVGIASADNCNHVAGRIASVDLTTHAVTSTNIVEPRFHGGSVWGSVSVDEGAGLVYAATGDHNVDPLASEPHAQSIMAFDAQTLAIKDSWQNTTPLTNADFGSSPALFNAADGTPLVAATSKDGFLYVLRRGHLSEGPVWTYKVAILDSSKPGEAGNPLDGYGTISSPVFAHGTLYAAGGRAPDPTNSPGSVVAFEPGTGQVKWIYRTQGYVLPAMAAVGDVLLVSSTALGNGRSWLDIVDQSSGTLLRSFDGNTVTYGAPSVGRGLIVWTDYKGRAQALKVPRYRP